MNELKINEKTTINYNVEPVKINGLDNLTNEISKIISKYNDLLVTAESYKGDKKIKTDLNKLYKRINDIRLQVGREYRKQVDVFNEQLNPILDDIKHAKDNIDIQLKTYDEKEKQHKHEQIVDFINVVSRNYEIDPDDVTIDPRFLNKSTSKKQWQDALIEQFKMLKADKQRKQENINQLNLFADQLGVDVTPYLRYLDNMTVSEIVEAMKIDIERAKAKEVATKSQQTVVKDKIINNETGEVIKSITTQLKIIGTLNKLNSLKTYMDNNGIIYEKVGD